MNPPSDMLERVMRCPRIGLSVVALLVVSCAIPNSKLPEPDPAAPERSGGAGSSAGTGGAPSAGAVDAPQASPAEGDAAAGPGQECPQGSHACEGVCRDSSRPEHCGRSCHPCPGIEGGTATCEAGKCGVKCPENTRPCVDKCVSPDVPCDDTCPMGKNKCGGVCVDAKSLSACGTSCTPCPSSSNGVSTCDGDKCELTCNPGFHRCGDTCVSDLDKNSCGTSCTPCPVPSGGEATCDGTKCGTRCPANTKICAGDCIPMNQACNGVCPAGQHDCDGNCVSDTNVNSCGKGGCMPCKPPANADPTCDGTRCGYKCRPGFHDCNGVCKADDSVDSCGDRCERCPSPPGTPVCRNKRCDFDCPGQTKCGNTCVDTRSSATHCGGCNSPCASPRTCSNGQCVCPAGREFCGNACVDPRTDTAHCGRCNSPCGSPRTCANGQCGCSGGREYCGNSCVDTKTDNANCGRCGAPCTGTGRTCQGGQCVCRSGLTDCNGCVDTRTSNQHCGRCNRSCGTNTACMNSDCRSTCVANFGQECRIGDCKIGKINCNGGCDFDRNREGICEGTCKRCVTGECRKDSTLCQGDQICQDSGQCGIPRGNACPAGSRNCISTTCKPIRACRCHNGASGGFDLGEDPDVVDCVGGSAENPASGSDCTFISNGMTIRGDCAQCSDILKHECRD